MLPVDGQFRDACIAYFSQDNLAVGDVLAVLVATTDEFANEALAVGTVRTTVIAAPSGV